jgi:hypothetical protein
MKGTNQKAAFYAVFSNIMVTPLSSSSSSSSLYTPCGAQGIHEELPGIVIYSYSLDLIP